MSQCDITSNDINIVCDLMMKQFNLGVEANLSIQENDILNKTTIYLDNLFRQNGIEFNPDGFKSFVKKIYPKDSTQFGGNSILKGGVPFVFGFKDFGAILSIIASIFMLYIAYVKLNKIVNELTNNSIIDLTSQTAMALINSSPELQKTIEAIRNLRETELSFLNVVMNSFNIYCKPSINIAFDNLEILVKNALMAGLVKVAAECGFGTKFVSDGWGLVGDAINFAGNAISVAVAPKKTITCSQDAALRLFQSIIKRSETETIQIHRLIQIGVSMGTGSIAYLIKRLNDYRASSRITNVEPTIDTSYQLTRGPKTNPYSKFESYSNTGGKRYKSRKYKTRKHKTRKYRHRISKRSKIHKKY